MSGSGRLDRRYRRLLACYPRAFRREHGDEVLGVLLAGASERQRGPGLSEAADLVRSGLTMRLRPRAPRSRPTVFAAVRLMYAAAALELVTLLTVLLTLGDVESAVRRHDPDLTAGQWHQVVAGQIRPLAIGAVLAAVAWGGLAWANGRGRPWARIVSAGMVLLTTVSLAGGLAGGSATYAPADVVAGGLLWLVALTAVALLFHPRSGPHFEHPVPGP